MAKHGQRDGVVPQPAASAPATYADKRTRWFDASLGKLDPTTRQEIQADVQEFVRDWKSGLSSADLRADWTYKRLSIANAPNRKVADRYNVHEFYALGNRYRVVISVDHRANNPCIYFIEIFKKQKDRQDADVGRAINRARMFWEARGDEPG